MSSYGKAAENDKFQFGNSQLLMDYRGALAMAYTLGEDIKKVYGIVPPKVYVNPENPLDARSFAGNRAIISLIVN